MLNIGAGEIAVILVVALLVLGPRRLPELARGIGKFMREFRRQTDEVRTTLETEFYRMDRDLLSEGPDKQAVPTPLSQNAPSGRDAASPASGDADAGSGAGGEGPPGEHQRPVDPGPPTPALSPGGGEGGDSKRPADPGPLTPALSPEKGEGETR